MRNNPNHGKQLLDELSRESNEMGKKIIRARQLLNELLGESNEMGKKIDRARQIYNEATIELDTIKSVRREAARKANATRKAQQSHQTE